MKKSEIIDIIDGDEIYCCEDKKYESERVKQAKEKELNSWKENNVYQDVEWKEGMKLINARWIVTEEEKEGEKIYKARFGS